MDLPGKRGILAPVAWLEVELEVEVREIEAWEMDFGMLG